MPANGRWDLIRCLKGYITHCRFFDVFVMYASLRFELISREVVRRVQL